jgi:hypothetical protein
VARDERRRVSLAGPDASWSFPLVRIDVHVAAIGIRLTVAIIETPAARIEDADRDPGPGGNLQAHDVLLREIVPAAATTIGLDAPVIEKRAEVILADLSGNEKRVDQASGDADGRWELRR